MSKLTSITQKVDALRSKGFTDEEIDDILNFSPHQNHETEYSPEIKKETQQPKKKQCFYNK